MVPRAGMTQVRYTAVVVPPLTSWRSRVGIERNTEEVEEDSPSYSIER